MARKRARARKTLRVSVPKTLYLTLNGIAGGDDRKLNKLVRTILEEKLATATVAELQAIVSPGKETEEKEGGEETTEEVGKVEGTE